MNAAPGQYVGPQRVAKGWMVFQLVSKVQRPQRYEELPATVLQALQSEVIEVKQRQRLASLSDSLRRAIPTQVHVDRLRFIPWPVSGGSDLPGA
jgi:parvulin-like peptidyl-prolyl isomerase